MKIDKEYGDCFIVTGIEIFADYLKDNDNMKYYDFVIENDYLQMYKRLLKFDIYLFIDVLEHFKRNKAIEVIEYLKENDKKIILIIPIAPKHWHQAEKFEKGNVYEKHLHNWTVEEVESV